MPRFAEIITGYAACVRALIAATDRADTQFRRREIHAVESLRLTFSDCEAKLGIEQGDEKGIWQRLVDARWAAHKGLGAPGDFGYDSPEGDAMRNFYNLEMKLED